MMEVRRDNHSRITVFPNLILGDHAELSLENEKNFVGCVPMDRAEIDHCPWIGIRALDTKRLVKQRSRQSNIGNIGFQYVFLHLIAAKGQCFARLCLCPFFLPAGFGMPALITIVTHFRKKEKPSFGFLQDIFSIFMQKIKNIYNQTTKTY